MKTIRLDVPVSPSCLKNLQHLLYRALAPRLRRLRSERGRVIRR